MSEIRARLGEVLTEHLTIQTRHEVAHATTEMLDALTPVVDALIAEAVAAKDAEIQRLTSEPNALALGLAYATEKDKRERLERRIAAVRPTRTRRGR